MLKVLCKRRTCLRNELGIKVLIIYVKKLPLKKRRKNKTKKQKKNFRLTDNSLHCTITSVDGIMMLVWSVDEKLFVYFKGFI